MKLVKTAIPDILVFEPQVFGDERGFFMETYRASWLEEQGIKAAFVQDNHSASVRGVLRGLHYQLDKPQGKLIRVIAGEVYDVAVDLRKNSPSFGRHVAFTLSDQNRNIAWIPPGFAHGFLVLSEKAEFVYKCTEYYDPQDEHALLWNDPELGIHWPLEAIGRPLVSEKDAGALPLTRTALFS